MPNRVISDGLLDSANVSRLHDETFRLYIYLFLSADRHGFVAIDYASIQRATPLPDWGRKQIAGMLRELSDAGLILRCEDEHFAVVMAP